MQKKRVSGGLFDRDGHCISFTLLEMTAVNKNQTMLLTFAPGIFVLMWSTGYVAAKFGLGYIEPLTFLALRFACVVSIMAVLFIVLRPPLPRTGSEWTHLAVVGFLLQSMYFGMCYQSFNAGLAVGTLALILSLQPIIVALVAPRWSGETVSWSRWLGLLLGLLGAGVVIVARSQIVAPSAIGFFFAVLALAGITGGSLWEKRFGVSHHPVTANLVGFSAGLLGIIPFMLVSETMIIAWSWPLLGSLTYLIIGSSLIGVGLLLAMIRAGDVARVSALFYLVPPLAAAFAWLVLDEAMPPGAWLGMVLSAIGVFMATRNRKVASR